MANFDESKHPRAEDGKFTSGSGSSSSTQSTGEKTYRQNASYGEILGKGKPLEDKGNTVAVKEPANKRKAEIINVLKNADINFEKWEHGEDIGAEGINFYFKDKQSQNKACRTLEPLLDRNLRNYGDYLFVPVETRREQNVRFNAERDEYVKKAVKSGKYKGTSEEIAEMIYMDSPYGIHSEEKIKSLVKKLINK